MMLNDEGFGASAWHAASKVIRPVCRTRSEMRAFSDGGPTRRSSRGQRTNRWREKSSGSEQFASHNATGGDPEYCQPQDNSRAWDSPAAGLESTRGTVAKRRA